jgi:hypothetical protein
VLFAERLPGQACNDRTFCGVSPLPLECLAWAEKDRQVKIAT